MGNYGVFNNFFKMRTLCTLPRSYNCFLFAFHVPDANEEKVTKRELVVGLAEVLLYAGLGALGTTYHVDESSCNFGAPLFLMLFGWPNVVLTGLRVVFRVVGAFAQAAFNSGLLFYGGFTIFPSLAQWRSSPQESGDEDYCHPVPFIAAYVVLVVKGLWFAVVFIAFPLCIFLSLCVGLNQAGYGYTKTNDEADKEIPI